MLSVIIPVYNGESYIGACIDNVLKQRCKNFELIIINDGSIDNTKEICEEISKRDKRVKLINIENGGVSNARNIGIENASGEYIGFIDSDDKIDENMYFDMINTIEEKKSDLVICAYRSIFNDRTEDEKFSWEDKLLDKNHIDSELIPKLISKIDENGNYQENIMGSACRCVFKRKIIEKNNLKFNKSLKISEDLLFLLQYIVKCKKIYTTNNIYYFYNRKTDIQLSTTQRYIPSLEDNLKFVNLEINKILKERNIELKKGMLLREVSNIYAMAINISRKDYKEGLFFKSKKIKELLNNTDFNSKLNSLGEENLFDMRRSIISLLKNRLQILVILYYSK